MDLSSVTNNKRVMDGGGIENGGFQLQENGHAKDDNSIANLVNTTSATCLYETHVPKRKKSLVQLTREALPRLENYRNSRRFTKRPSLGELHGGEDSIKVIICFNNLIKNKKFCKFKMCLLVGEISSGKGFAK